MGAENSILEDSQIDKEYFQTSDWNLHNGIWKNSAKRLGTSSDYQEISVFRKTVGHGNSKRDIAVHENLGKSLKLFRHPAIVKYFASGRKSDEIFVVTERITPISKAFESFSSLEICAGLYSILQALEFCHDNCNAWHNNFGIDSVFVTTDGTWKIAGMEFLCRKEELNEEFLQKNRAFRNENLIPPEEKDGRFAHLAQHGHAGDVYALGLLIKDMLEYISKTEDVVPHAKEFLSLVRTEVLSSDPTVRPSVRKLIQNEFFKNDFLEIATFLKHITLKGDYEKEEFFRTLTKRLSKLPEALIATRLSTLLLARFVLLDKSAERFFLQHFLRPCRGFRRSEEHADDCVNCPVLTTDLFREHVIPIVTGIFEVLDFDIRMVLLRHFEYYVDLFDRDVLANKILPQVLLGVKDVSNELVTCSLHALAFIVPVVGGDVVIGKQRCNYFSKAKPKVNSSKVELNGQLSVILNVMSELKPNEVTLADAIVQPLEVQSKAMSCSDDAQDEILPDLERSSPDGSEASDVEARTIEDCEWSDWEGLAKEEGKTTDKWSPPNQDEEIWLDGSGIKTDHIKSGNRAKSLLNLQHASRQLGEEFDIVAKKQGSDDDFFVDMQPVITKCVATNVTQEKPVSTGNQRLSYTTVDEDTPTGTAWGDEDLTWTDNL